MASPPDDQQIIRASALAQDLRALLGKLKRRLREQAHVGDFSPSRASVLLRLEKEGPATASSLARAEGMRPQSMAPVVAALANAGLAVGAPDPADGRQTLIALTDGCRKMIGEGRAARQDWLTRMLQARLSGPEQNKVAKAVELLKRLVDARRLLDDGRAIDQMFRRDQHAVEEHGVFWRHQQVARRDVVVERAGLEADGQKFGSVAGETRRTGAGSDPWAVQQNRNGIGRPSHCAVALDIVVTNNRAAWRYASETELRSAPPRIAVARAKPVRRHFAKSGVCRDVASLVRRIAPEDPLERGGAGARLCRRHRRRGL